ncbi:oligopeptide transport system permease protein [Streptococcus gallolyticus]|uniref:Oligopeptide transport system permease protein n=1 Tax=Streptococcus gallolyticus TaxID=315405 RepID=A0A1H9LKP3_9STRE|nr:oligopeptide transport system permease protein [Streptococcus gallolyticus]
MTSIDKEQFEFVTLDSAASETIDAPTYSYWKSVFKQFFSRKSTTTQAVIASGKVRECLKN